MRSAGLSLMPLLPVARVARSALALAAAAALLAAAGAHAQDRADLDRTQITGNRELPKVLYIVPWKKPAPLALAGRPVTSVLDEALAPVERDVLRRQLRFDAQLRAAAADPVATPVPPAPEKAR